MFLFFFTLFLFEIPQISNTEKLNEFYSLEIKTINEFTTSKMKASLVGKEHLELGDEEHSYESFSISEDANYLAIELTWKNSDFSKIDIYDISNRNKVKKIKTFKNLFFASHLFEGHTFYYSTVCAKVSKTKKTKSKFVKFCPVLNLTEEFYSIDITGIPSFIEISSNNLYYSFAEETLVTSLNKLNLSSLKEETMLDNLTNSAVDSSCLNGFYVSDYNKSYPNGVIYRINPLHCSKKFIHMSFDQSFTLKEFRLDEFNNLYAIGLNEKAENVFKLFNDEGKELVHKNFKYADTEIYSIEGEDITFKLSSMDWIRKLVVYNTRTSKYKTKTFIPSVNSKIKTKYKVIKGVPCIVYEPQNKIDRVIMTGYGGFFDQGHMTYNPKLNLLLDKGYTIVNVILSGDGFFGYNSYINGKNQIFRVSEFATVAEQFKKKNKVFAFVFACPSIINN